MKIKKNKYFILAIIIFISFLSFTNTATAEEIAITSLDAGTCNSQSIDITWNDVSVEDGYILYRNGTTTDDIVETLPAASSGPYSYTDNFSDGSFATNTTYTYVVEYYTSAGATTTSASVSVTSAQECAECGSINNTVQLTKPTNTNLCSIGTYSSVTASSTSGDWEWTCTNAGDVSNCSANVDVRCGGVTPTDTKPTTDLCITGNSTSTAVDTNTDNTKWVWNCRNDDAYNDGITIENSCDVENTNWVYIKEFNINPRIVSTTTDECTINYTIESTNSASTTCQLNDTSGATSTLIFVDDVAASTSKDINPGKSYQISCEFDDGTTNVQKETEYRSCNLNPSFDIF